MNSPVINGSGGLEVEMVSGQSAVVSAWARSPLKLLIPHSRGPSVWAYVSSFGGGLVAGDELDIDVHIRPGARCFLTSQASTKVYRNPARRPCGQRLKARIGEGSLLVLAPEPVAAFADSIYYQRQEFHLESTAGLVALDWISSGRPARGERWSFANVRSSNEVFRDGGRLLLDSLLLDRAHGPLTAAHRLGRFNCLASIIIVGTPLAATAANLLNAVGAEPVRRRAPVVISASPVREGVLLRLAGERIEDVIREARRRLDFVPALLGGDPWERKW